MRWTIAHMTVRISCIASALPTQFIGPIENGMNAASLCAYPGPWQRERGSDLGRQRSGRKEEGEGEKLCGSVCIE